MLKPCQPHLRTSYKPRVGRTNPWSWWHQPRGVKSHPQRP